MFERERVRWGVLGNARIARLCVIPAIQKSCNGLCSAIASRSPDTAQEVAAQHSIPHVYGSYEALLADPAIDAVYIPLPNHLHKPWALAAFGAGKHVLCEKPLALNVGEAQQMAQAAEAAGLCLMEAFMYRFHPRSQRIKEWVEQGRVGEPRLIRAAFCFSLRDPDNIRLLPEAGGGALLDVGCYGVSVARWLLGSEPEDAQAQAAYGPSGVDLNFVGLLRFPEGRLAVVEASFVSALQQTFTVVGSEGAIDLPHDAFVPKDPEVIFYLRGIDEAVGSVQTIQGADPYQLMVEHFGDAVLGKGSLGWSPQDSINNMRVLDALAEAARSGRSIPIRG